MRVAVMLEQHFLGTPDGAVYTDSTHPYAFWTRYLEVFSAVRVVARVREVERAASSWSRVDGAGVEVARVPDYRGALGFILRARSVRRATREGVGVEDAVILKAPSPLANGVESIFVRSGRPFGLEVVGDPWDVFAPGVVAHPLRPLLRRWLRRRLRRQCQVACARAYVTAETLQRRYPPGPGLTVAVSDVALPEEAFAPHPRAESEGSNGALVLVGSLEQLYKGPDVLLGAMASCARAGLDLQLAIVGDGRFRRFLEVRVRELGLSGRVRFTGRIPPGAPVAAELDRASVFVLPSRTEGLPRALIEAMARGLPCIATHVGGIPELLEAADLVPPGDSAALGRKIIEVLTAPARRAAMSARNLARARAFGETHLREPRLAFYRHVHSSTEAWLRRTPRNTTRKGIEMNVIE